MFTQSDRSRRIRAIGSDEGQDVGQGQRCPLAWRLGQAGDILADGARRLEAADAEALVLCTDIMHTVADMITAAIDIPFIHIADATAAAIRATRLTRVGLLGTRYTMERDFYRGRRDSGLAWADEHYQPRGLLAKDRSVGRWRSSR